MMKQMQKTDLEIAFDAIKYCRAKLGEYYNLIDKYENEDFKKMPSKTTYQQFQFEAARLEYILGMRVEKPQWKDYVKENYFI